MSRLSCLVSLAVGLAGCATFANTPAQERTYSAIEKCRGLQPAEVVVTRVDADGRYWSRVRTSRSDPGTAEWQACIRSGGPR
jgi:hypothetical protein